MAQNTTCPKCGNLLPAGVKFCNICGTQVGSAAPAPGLIPGRPLPVVAGPQAIQGITKAQLREYLNKFGIPNERIYELPPEKIAQAPEADRETLRNFLIVPYKLTFKGPQGELALVFEVKLMIIKKWINIKLMLMRHEELPPNLKAVLHERLLISNFELNEVTYSCSPQGDVFVEADMPVNTDFTNFQSEYGSIEFGVVHFLKDVLPTLANVQAKSTYRPALYT